MERIREVKTESLGKDEYDDVNETCIESNETA